MKSGSEAIAVTRFSTDDFRPQDRHEAWANRDWPTIGPVFDATPLGVFHNRSDRFALGALTVHVADMAGQRYARTADRVRRSGLDQFAMTLTLSGHVRGDSAGRDVRSGPGALCFGDFAQPQALDSSDSRTVLVTMPRAIATSRGLDVGTLHGTVVGPRDAALLRSHLLAIHAALPDLSVAQGDRLQGTVLDLVAVALDQAGARAPVEEAARDTATRIAARVVIDARLDRPGLTVAWLCGELGVSRSTLYRLFEPEGGVTAYIRARRLARVRLTLEAGGPERLADLAERWGFSDAAHLSRLFRAAFGESPSALRDRTGRSGTNARID